MSFHGWLSFDLVVHFSDRQVIYQKLILLTTVDLLFWFCWVFFSFVKQWLLINTGCKYGIIYKKVSISPMASTYVYWFLYGFLSCIRLFRVLTHVLLQCILFLLSHTIISLIWNTLLLDERFAAGLVFLLFLCRTENLIIQWALENVLIEICHIFNIYYSDIGAS